MSEKFPIGSTVVYAPSDRGAPIPCADAKAVVTRHPHTDRHEHEVFIAFASGIVVLVHERDLLPSLC
jgi:hypothetical protein